ELLRCVLGSPFRPVALDPAWRTPTIVALAQAAYEERSVPAGTLDIGRLAVLGDALQDAGCDKADILSHLRSPGPHVVRFWALDRILDRHERATPKGRSSCWCVLAVAAEAAYPGRWRRSGGRGSRFRGVS